MKPFHRKQHFHEMKHLAPDIRTTKITKRYLKDNDLPVGFFGIAMLNSSAALGFIDSWGCHPCGTPQGVPLAN